MLGDAPHGAPGGPEQGTGGEWAWEPEPHPPTPIPDPEECQPSPHLPQASASLAATQHPAESPHHGAPGSHGHPEAKVPALPLSCPQAQKGQTWGPRSQVPEVQQDLGAPEGAAGPGPHLHRVYNSLTSLESLEG